jgi:hypothetical protein
LVPVPLRLEDSAIAACREIMSLAFVVGNGGIYHGPHGATEIDSAIDRPAIFESDSFVATGGGTNFPL